MPIEHRAWLVETGDAAEGSKHGVACCPLATRYDIRPPQLQRESLAVFACILRCSLRLCLLDGNRKKQRVAGAAPPMYTGCKRARASSERSSCRAKATAKTTYSPTGNFLNYMRMRLLHERGLQERASQKSLNRSHARRRRPAALPTYFLPCG